MRVYAFLFPSVPDFTQLEFDILDFYSILLNTGPQIAFFSSVTSVFMKFHVSFHLLAQIL